MLVVAGEHVGPAPIAVAAKSQAGGQDRHRVGLGKGCCVLGVLSGRAEESGLVKDGPAIVADGHGRSHSTGSSAQPRGRARPGSGDGRLVYPQPWGQFAEMEVRPVKTPPTFSISGT